MTCFDSRAERLIAAAKCFVSHEPLPNTRVVHVQGQVIMRMISFCACNALIAARVTLSSSEEEAL